MTTNALILLRGLPGSGKSTLAVVLSEDGKYPVYSVDDYFTTENGYNFDFKNNHLAYKQCETQTEESMKKNVAKILIHNTFTIEWELEAYFKLAKLYNYTIYVCTIENYHNGENTHGVSNDQLLKMAQKYKVRLL